MILIWILFLSVEGAFKRVHHLLNKLTQENRENEFHVKPSFQNNQRGLIASKNFAVNDTIMAIYTNSVFWCAWEKLLMPCSTKLAIQMYRRKKSKYYHQIRSAPTIAEYRKIMPHYKTDLVRKFRNVFKTYQLDFMETFKERFPDENEQRAYFILKSRSFRAVGYIAWIGMVDLMNHKYDANAILDLEKPNWFRVLAKREIRKGEEIFIKYNDMDNSDLLFTYGFVEDNNPKKASALSKLECDKLKSVILEELNNPEAQPFIQLAKERCPNMSIEMKHEL